MKILDLFPHRRLNEHSFIKHSYLFLNEAVYDTKIASLKKKFPESIPDIDTQVTWAKSIFKTPGQINWWCNFFGDYLENKLTTKQLGDYQFNSIDKLQTDISHYFGFNYQPILTFVFDNKTVNQILTDLHNLENQYKQKQEKDTPVPIKEGDYKLYEFPDGTAWWYVNRAYCEDEAKSGKHCGNVVGKHKPTQRILSLRNKAGNVILTFIYEPDGTLGEMKAKGNQKPTEKYHQHIYTLLMGNKLPIKGITGMGYLPEMNFSVFDFDEGTLKDIFNNKPNLIKTQLQVTPNDLLVSPVWIRQDPEYQRIAFNKLPGLQHLIDKDGTIKSDNDSWEEALTNNEQLIFYAPDTVYEYYERILHRIENHPRDLLLATDKLRKDFKFLCHAIGANDEVLGYIVPTTPRYNDLCKFAVTRNGYSLESIPEELRNKQLCELAVSKKGMALEHVPKQLQTMEMCELAIKQNHYAMTYVPPLLRNEHLYLLSLKVHNLDLRYVPNELKTEKFCLAAIEINSSNINFVPGSIINEKLCLAAVTRDGTALKLIPDELRNEDICLAAVRQNKRALVFVPKSLKQSILDQLTQEN
jgi:hypothetical protein